MNANLLCLLSLFPSNNVQTKQVFMSKINRNRYYTIQCTNFCTSSKAEPPYDNGLHERRNLRDSWDLSQPYFQKFSAISKNIRQRSLQQMVQKLQPIIIFDFCKALLTLAMKVLGFPINTYSYLPSKPKLVLSQFTTGCL